MADPAPREPQDGAPIFGDAVRFPEGIWGVSIEAQDLTSLGGMPPSDGLQRTAQICGGDSGSDCCGAVSDCVAAPDSGSGWVISGCAGVLGRGGTIWLPWPLPSAFMTRK